MSYTDFSLPPGVVRGATSKMTPGRWWDSSLIRFRQGQLAPIGGWSRMTSTALDGVPRSLLGWNSNADLKYMGIFTSTKLYYMVGNTFTDITPTSYNPPETSTAGGYGSGPYGAEAYGTARTGVAPSFSRAPLLTLDSWGDQLVACSSSDGRLLRFIPGTSTLAEPIPSSNSASVPVSNRATLVTPERHMLAMCAGGNPRRIAWSGREDYGDWDFVGSTSAGYIDADTHGYLMAMGTVRDGTLIWSDTDLFRLRYVGQPFVHGLDKIQENTTLLCPYAHIEFGGKSFWVTREGFMVYEAGAGAQPVPCELAEFFFANIDPVWGRRTTTCVLSNLFDEVYIFYPSTGSNENDSYICWNFTENHWTKGKLARSAGIPALIDDLPCWASPDGHLWAHESGSAFTSFGVNPGDIFAETGGISPGNGQLVTVNRIVSDTELGAQSTAWTFYTRMTPEGPESSVTYTPRSDGYIDTRFTARLLRIRISQNQDGRWTMGKPEADIVIRGKR